MLDGARGYYRAQSAFRPHRLMEETGQEAGKSKTRVQVRIEMVHILVARETV